MNILLLRNNSGIESHRISIATYFSTMANFDKMGFNKWDHTFRLIKCRFFIPRKEKATPEDQASEVLHVNHRQSHNLVDVDLKSLPVHNVFYSIFIIDYYINSSYLNHS